MTAAHHAATPCNTLQHITTQVSRGYGHMTADDQFENLYHVSSCHSESCFAVDLEFDSPSGVTTNLGMTVLAYNCDTLQHTPTHCNI